jgi:NAD(P)-dependent dehydrogenase (short-subunit alcohol dehydrogenase family)
VAAVLSAHVGVGDPRWRGRLVTVVELDRVPATEASARRPAALAVGAHASDEAGLRTTVERSERRLGPNGIFFASAGIATRGGLDAPEEFWKASIDVNLMTHVRATRILVPRWLERGAAHFVSTASAPGLVAQIDFAASSVPKHAAAGVAEWFWETYGDKGIGVSWLCATGATGSMLEARLRDTESSGSIAARAVAAAGAVLEPEEVARATIAEVREGWLAALPHPEVLEFSRCKGADYDPWLAAMRRLQGQLGGEASVGWRTGCS